MIEAILQTSGSEFIAAINLAVSAVAALVALLVLWFTALKGPDIAVVSSHAKVDYMEPPKADQSLTRFEFKPVDVVFANNGSRSGALIQIFAGFKPVDSFEPYYGMVFVSAELRSDKSTDATLQLPAIIPERGTLVVTMKLSLLLRSWKDMSRLETVQGDMKTALKAIWQNGQNLLRQFSVLEGPIGTFDLSAQRTTRRRFRTAVGEKVVAKLLVPPVPEWVLAEARKGLTKFGDVYPPDDYAVTFIRTVLDQISNDVSHNSGVLSSSVLSGGLQALSVAGWDRWFGIWGSANDQTYRPVITRNVPLSSQINAYYQAGAKYNRRINAASPVERQALETLRLEINKMAEQLGRDLEQYRQELVDATGQLLPAI